VKVLLRITGGVWIGLICTFSVLLIGQHTLTRPSNIDVIPALLGLTVLLLLPGIALVQPDIEALDEKLVKYDQLDHWLFWIALISTVLLMFMGVVE